MNHAAFLFPGQGSQFPGMGKSLFDHSETARKMFHAADAILGFSLSGLCFNGPEETLRATGNAQPALFLVSAVLVTLLREKGIEAGMMAGHSLGEYTALWAAESIDLEQALRLVRTRGQLMAEAGQARPGTMAAVMGLDAGQVVDACREASEFGVVAPANFNCPGQVVISGEQQAVAKALEVAKGRGAAKTIMLQVSGAFHSQLLRDAAEQFGEVLAGVPFREPKAKVVSNVTAEPFAGPDEIRRILKEQLCAPVRWEECVRRLVQEGADHFFEVGPGRVLTGLSKRIDRSIPCAPVGEWEEVSSLGG